MLIWINDQRTYIRSCVVFITVYQTYLVFLDICTQKSREKKCNLLLLEIAFRYSITTSSKTLIQLILFHKMFRNNNQLWIPIFSCIFLSYVGFFISLCLILSLIPLYLSNRSVEKSNTIYSGSNFSSIEYIFTLI